MHPGVRGASNVRLGAAGARAPPRSHRDPRLCSGRALWGGAQSVRDSGATSALKAHPAGEPRGVAAPGLLPRRPPRWAICDSAVRTSPPPTHTVSVPVPLEPVPPAQLRSPRTFLCKQVRRLSLPVKLSSVLGFLGEKFLLPWEEKVVPRPAPAHSVRKGHSSFARCTPGYLGCCQEVPLSDFYLLNSGQKTCCHLRIPLSRVWQVTAPAMFKSTNE